MPSLSSSTVPAALRKFTVTSVVPAGMELVSTQARPEGAISRLVQVAQWSKVMVW